MKRLKLFFVLGLIIFSALALTGPVFAEEKCEHIWIEEGELFDKDKDNIPETPADDYLFFMIASPNCVHGEIYSKMCAICGEYAVKEYEPSNFEELLKEGLLFERGEKNPDEHLPLIDSWVYKTEKAYFTCAYCGNLIESDGSRNGGKIAELCKHIWIEEGELFDSDGDKIPDTVADLGQFTHEFDFCTYCIGRLYEKKCAICGEYVREEYGSSGLVELLREDLVFARGEKNQNLHYPLPSSEYNNENFFTCLFCGNLLEVDGKTMRIVDRDCPTHNQTNCVLHYKDNKVYSTCEVCGKPKNDDYNLRSLGTEFDLNIDMKEIPNVPNITIGDERLMDDGSYNLSEIYDLYFTTELGIGYPYNLDGMFSYLCGELQEDIYSLSLHRLILPDEPLKAGNSYTVYAMFINYLQPHGNEKPACGEIWEFPFTLTIVKGKARDLKVTVSPLKETYSYGDTLTVTVEGENNIGEETRVSAYFDYFINIKTISQEDTKAVYEVYLTDKLLPSGSYSITAQAGFGGFLREEINYEGFFKEEIKPEFTLSLDKSNYTFEDAIHIEYRCTVNGKPISGVITECAIMSNFVNLTSDENGVCRYDCPLIDWADWKSDRYFIWVSYNGNTVAEKSFGFQAYEGELNEYLIEYDDYVEIEVGIERFNEHRDGITWYSLSDQELSIYVQDAIRGVTLASGGSKYSLAIKDEIKFEPQTKDHSCTKENNVIELKGTFKLGNKEYPVTVSLTMKYGKYTDGSGSCGKNAKWTFVASSKTLTISGSGAVDRTIDSILTEIWGGSRGWSRTRDISIIIEEGITSVVEDPIEIPFGNATYYKLPSTLKVLPIAAFGYNNYLTSLVIPEGVEEINAFAFFNCPNLSCLKLPKSLKKLDVSAFYMTGNSGVSEFKIYYAGSEEDWNKIDFSCQHEQEMIAAYGENYMDEITPYFDSNFLSSSKGVIVFGDVKGDTAVINDISVDKSLTSEVLIDLKAENQVNNVSFSSELMNSIKNQYGNMSVGLPNGTISISQATFEEMMNQISAQDVTLVLKLTPDNELNAAQKTAIKNENVESCVSIEIKDGDTNITSFNGQALTVALNYSATNDKQYTVKYIAPDGSVETMKTYIENGKVYFTTDHLSTYFISAEGNNRGGLLLGLPIVAVLLISFGVLAAFGITVIVILKVRKKKKTQENCSQ